MESDNEQSLASSISSLSRRVIGFETNTAESDLRHEGTADIDDFSTEASDYDMDGLIGTGDVHQVLQDSPIKGPLSKIPPEVMLLIFSQITEKSKLVPLLTVCKSWADLVVELIWFRPTLEQKTLERVVRTMQEDRTKTYWDYRLYIRRLNLSFLCDSVDDNFLSLFIDCPNLERLTLVGCSRLSYRPIAQVLKGCSKLQSIDLTGVREINDDILLALASSCHRLQGLYAPDCPAVTNRAILWVVENCRLLKRVKISDNENIDDGGLAAMAEKCKALIEVDVHNCPNLSDYALQKVFTDLSQLREFRVSHNQNVSDLILSNLTEPLFLEKLRVIDFTGCLRITDRLVERIVQFAPRLRNVVLSKCSNLTDASLRSLAILGKNLHYVHLGHCTNITDHGVTTLVRNCHRLQYIDLACCIQLTNLSVVELAALPKLKRIGLVKCVEINDAGILQLIQRRGYDDSLERVHLSYCTNIGIFPIYQLLESCPRLTHLSLTGVQSFLRSDITRFCRQPPPDFNANQKALFCVFSGEGVKQLREYLRRVMAAREHDQINELELQNMTPAENIQRVNELFFIPLGPGTELNGQRQPIARFPVFRQNLLADDVLIQPAILQQFQQQQQQQQQPGFVRPIQDEVFNDQQVATFGNDVQILPNNNDDESRGRETPPDNENTNW